MDMDVELPEDYRGRWETFVDQTLSETNRKNTIDLVQHASLQYQVVVCDYAQAHVIIVANIYIYIFFLLDWQWEPTSII